MQPPKERSATCRLSAKTLTDYNGRMHEEITTARNVAEKFLLDGNVSTVSPFGNGRINATYLVMTDNGTKYVLQRLNPIFAPSVLEDIRALTHAMKERGFTTTELVPTRSGDLGIIENGQCSRMLTFIPGRTIENGITQEEARSAMALIGRFHQAFADHDHQFAHVRKGFHDTPQIMEGLEKTIADYRGTEKHTALATLGADIEAAHNANRHAWAHLPKRIIHGDPKLSNIRFAADSPRAIALLDLDTMGRHSIVVDIADAARSWCNQHDEGDAKHARFDLDIFRVMMEGYAETADFLTKEEREAIPGAIAQIALELSARFATDAYRESYFTLDREHYPDLFTQNSAKARAQFALHQDVVRKFSDIIALSSSV